MSVWFKIYMTERKQDIYRNEEDLNIHKSILRLQTIEETKEGKYGRLLKIQWWLVSKIFGFVFACFLNEDESGDTF